MDFGPATGVEKLQAEVRRKSAQLDVFETKLSQATQELEEVKSSHSQLSKVSAQRDAQLKELEKQNAQLTAALRKSGAAVSSLTDQLGAAKPGRPNSGGQVPTPNGPLSRQGSESGSDAAELEALRAELAAKERQLQQLQADLAAVHAPSGLALPTRQDSIDGNAAPWDATRVRALRDEAETWKGRADGLMLEVKNLQKKLQATELERAEVSDRAAVLGEAKVAAEDQLKAARQELAALRGVADQSRTELKTQLQRKDSDMMRLITEQDRQADLAQQLQAQLDKAGPERERLAQGLQAVQAQLGRVQEELRERTVEATQVQARVMEQMDQLEKLQTELKAMQVVKAGREAQCEELAARLASATRGRADGEAELRALSERADAGHVGQQEVEGALKAAMERIEQAEVTMGGLRVQQAKLQKQLDAKDRQLMEAVDRLEQKHAEFEGQSRSVALEAEDRAALKEGVARGEGRAAALQEQLAAKSAAVAELSVALDAVRAEAKERAQELAEATAQLEHVRGAMDRSGANAESEAAELKALLTGKNGQLEDLVGQVDELTAKLKDAEQGHVLIKQHSDSARMQLAALQLEHETVQNQITQLLADKEALQGSLEERDEVIARKEEKILQMEGLLAQVEKLNGRIEDGQGALKLANAQFAGMQDELTQAQEQISERQTALEAARAAMAAKDIRLSDALMDAQQQAASVAVLERQLKDCEERLVQYDSATAGVDMKVGDLKIQLRDLELERDDAKRELSSARQESIALGREVQELEEKMAQQSKKIEALMDEVEGAMQQGAAEADAALRHAAEEARAELQMERKAHAATQVLLVAEQERVAAPAAAGSPLRERGSLSPREAAHVRQEVLDLEGSLTQLLLDDVQRQLVAQEAEVQQAAVSVAVAAPAAALQQEEEEDAAEEVQPADEPKLSPAVAQLLEAEEAPALGISRTTSHRIELDEEEEEEVVSAASQLGPSQEEEAGGGEMDEGEVSSPLKGGGATLSEALATGIRTRSMAAAGAEEEST